jgi:hypothetical protein
MFSSVDGFPAASGWSLRIFGVPVTRNRHAPRSRALRVRRPGKARYRDAVLRVGCFPDGPLIVIRQYCARLRSSQRKEFHGAASEHGAGRAIAPQVRKHMRTILLIILVILILGALPTWPYSAGWGYYPSGGLGLLLLILLILAVMGKL